MARKLVIFLVFALTATLVSSRQCPQCDKEECPPAPTKCLAGTVEDSCGCCLVCGNLEGDRCDRGIDNGVDADTQFGPCGDNLQCTGRSDLPETDSVCICTQQKMLCGSNKQTYENLCQLMEDANDSGEKITIDRQGPCIGEPWIATAPDDAHIYEGENTSLTCEAMGNPVPLITWSFVSENHDEKQLPSDDDHFSVQLRGGPEKFEMTSWLAIESARSTDQGSYRCVAKNEEGQKDTYSTVKVYKKGQTIPAEGLIPVPREARTNRNLLGQTRARRERRWQDNSRHGEI